jgi:hypothetical protein
LSDAAVHCHGQPLDDFTGIRADHVATQNFIRRMVNDDFIMVLSSRPVNVCLSGLKVVL